MADIEIRMLGKFEILMDGKPVLAALKQSRKATMLIQYLVLQKAALHRQHLVGAGRVDAGGEFSTGGGGKGGNDLVAVVVGRFHPPDGGDRAVFSQQGADVGLFLFELCGVFGGQHRAAAAVFGAKFAIHYHILLKPDRRVHCLTDDSAFSSSTS